jgi:putative Holliday junction resolvase
MPGRILAIDFGTVRMGIAISDPTRTIATPLAVVPNSESTLDEIATLVSGNDVGEILIGLPLNVDNSDSSMTQRVRAFAKEVEARTGLPIILYDERYSSMIAQEIMIETGKSRKQRRVKGELDKRAAAAMLQEYLSAK